MRQADFAALKSLKKGGIGKPRVFAMMAYYTLH
jgi:hypothetical protein